LPALNTALGNLQHTIYWFGKEANGSEETIVTIPDSETWKVVALLFSGGTNDTSSATRLQLTRGKTNDIANVVDENGGVQHFRVQSVDVRTPTEGLMGSTTYGNVAKFDGTTWTLLTSDENVLQSSNANDVINQVKFYEENAAYVVMQRAGTLGKVGFWNGETITLVINDSSNQLRALDVLDSDFALVGGYNGTIYHIDGGIATLQTPVSSDHWYMGASIESDSLAYLSGSDFSAPLSPVGILDVWDGTSWANDAAAPAGYTYFWDVDIVSTTFGGIAVSDQAIGASTCTSTIYHWDGTNWAEATGASVSDINIMRLDYYDKNFGLAVAYELTGSVMHLYTWNGTTWAEDTTTTLPDEDGLALALHAHQDHEGYIFAVGGSQSNTNTSQVFFGYKDVVYRHRLQNIVTNGSGNFNVNISPAVYITLNGGETLILSTDTNLYGSVTGFYYKG
jgi:hypothetical protein